MSTTNPNQSVRKAVRKTAKRQIKKAARKNPAAVIILFLLVVAVVIGLLAADRMGYIDLSGIIGSSETTDGTTADNQNTDAGGTVTSFSMDDIPAFTDQPYVTINDNKPTFTEAELDLSSYATVADYEVYSELDSLGRCGVAFAIVCVDTMPTGDRDFSLSSIKPTGWEYNGVSNNHQYDIIPGYIYNRCHLIGWQLTAESTNKQNLITGTRYMNVGDSMVAFENLVADYVKETNNHVAYRVTPVFEGNNLVASGVQMEAWSIEDNGEGVCFNVYCYNNQPGITINYATGENWLTEDADAADDAA